MNSASDTQSGGDLAGGVGGVNSIKYLPFKSTTSTTNPMNTKSVGLTGLGGVLNTTKNSSASFDTTDLMSSALFGPKPAVPTAIVYSNSSSGPPHHTVLANKQASFNTDTFSGVNSGSPNHGSNSNVTIMMKPLVSSSSGGGGTVATNNVAVNAVSAKTTTTNSSPNDFANISLDTIKANGAIHFSQLRNPLNKERSKDRDKDDPITTSSSNLKGSSSLTSNVNNNSPHHPPSTSSSTPNTSVSSWSHQNPGNTMSVIGSAAATTAIISATAATNAVMNELFMVNGGGGSSSSKTSCGQGLLSSKSNSNASLTAGSPPSLPANSINQSPVMMASITASRQLQQQPNRCYLTYVARAQPESMDSATSTDEPPPGMSNRSHSPGTIAMRQRQHDSARNSIASNNPPMMTARASLNRSSAHLNTNTSENISKELANSNGWLVNANQTGSGGGSATSGNRPSNSGGELIAANGPSPSGGGGGGSAGGGGGAGSSDNENTALYQASSRLADPSSSNFSRGGGGSIGAKEKKSSVGYRLGKRKLLFEKRRQISDYALMFAMTGVFLMIIETEFSMSKMYTKSSSYSYMIKSLITITTLILISLILLYHALEVQLFIIDNCIEDWRIAMTWQRMTQIAVEVIVCFVHPIAGNFTFFWTTKIANTNEERRAEVPIDLILSLPMFLRLYLICRSMLLHSKLFTDASSRSIGALNRINFNTRFVLKTLMTICPGTVLLVFILSLFIIVSWTIRACESFHDAKHGNLLNSMWLIAVTFLAIGYGDLVPNTYCGRAICVVSGLMGVSCTATMVAVLARKLELARAEKHVHFFMMDTQLNKRLKNAAANVLRETWLIYKYTKLVQVINPSRVRAHQRKFLQAIHSLRKVKLDQRKLDDNQNQLVDLSKVANTQKDLHDIVLTLNINQNSIVNRLRDLEDKMSALQNQLNMLPLQMQSIIMEQNKLVLDKFQKFQKQSSLSYSGGNSFDGESNSNANTNALQIPTISTNLTRN